MILNVHDKEWFYNQKDIIYFSFSHDVKQIYLRAYKVLYLYLISKKKNQKTNMFILKFGDIWNKFKLLYFHYILIIYTTQLIEVR